MAILKTFLKKIKKEVYRWLSDFCERRANKAFDRSDVMLYMYWTKLTFKYGEKYIGLRKALN